jgi:ectoine hydroxylase-related dioxygenase (phytanoyl-CoA dioxygenase family)
VFAARFHEVVAEEISCGRLPEDAMIDGHTEVVRPGFTDAHLDEILCNGLVLIPGFFAPHEIRDAVADIRTQFGGVARDARQKEKPELLTDDVPRVFSPDEWFDAHDFPYDSPALNLIGCHPAILEAVKRLLQADKVTMHFNYTSAKFSGYKNYSQPLHLDSPTHSLLMSSDERRFSSVNCVVYLSDVDDEHGPLSYVPLPATSAIRGWKKTLTPEENALLAPQELRAVAPMGSLMIYVHHLYHRATNLTASGAARYQIVSAFHSSEASAFIGGVPWPRKAFTPNWKYFFPYATLEQLEAIGIPGPAHPYWTEHIIQQLSERYPFWDVSIFRQHLRRD